VEANNRSLPKWFERVTAGQLRLPRFQRYEEWDHRAVAELLESVLRGLPFGVALVLTVGDGEIFPSRPLTGAPTPTEKPTEQLLDGQQRLTALWRAFTDNYEDRTYLVCFGQDEDVDGDGVQPQVVGVSRWMGKNGVRYPAWADSVKEVHERQFIPLSLLRPGDLLKEVNDWCSEAEPDDYEARDAVKDTIIRLRETVNAANLPFLSLEAKTPKGVALEVFIRMNSHAVQLTAFDVVVAQMEGATGRSLHDLVSGIKEVAPNAGAYGDISQWALAVAALREDHSPSSASFLKLDLERLVDTWDDILAGMAFAVECLEEQNVFDAERLPASPVLSVLAALDPFVGQSPDHKGAAKTLLRKYLWRAFLTRRYESSTNLRTLQDYRGLREILADGRPWTAAPIFDESENPLPTVEELQRARWPKMKDILGRGILAAALRRGAEDLADGTKVSRSNVRCREYHHLFPEALLAGVGGLPTSEIYRALNCVLITWKTNRVISAKDPVTYLRDRTQAALLGEGEIRDRLATHLAPFRELNVGGYEEDVDAMSSRRRLLTDYATFLEVRAKVVHDEIMRLCALPNPSEVRSE